MTPIATMSFQLDLTSPAAADAVLDAIRSKAAYWQESVVPPDLRRMGALGVRARIEGLTFELALEDLGRDPPPTEFSLRGKVTPIVAGGSRIQAWPARDRYEWIGVAIVALLAVSLLWSGQIVFGVIVLVGSGVLAARTPSPRAADTGFQHLTERLHLALQGVMPMTPPCVT
jgi:hypothetical protein